MISMLLHGGGFNHKQRRDLFLDETAPDFIRNGTNNVYMYIISSGWRLMRETDLERRIASSLIYKHEQTSMRPQQDQSTRFR